MGHMEDASVAFRAAAELVPVNYASGIVEQLSQAAAYAQQAGGGLGEGLAHETASILGQAQELTALLAGLKDRLTIAAEQVLQSGG